MFLIQLIIISQPNFTFLLLSHSDYLNVRAVQRDLLSFNVSQIRPNYFCTVKSDVPNIRHAFVSKHNYIPGPFNFQLHQLMRAPPVDVIVINLAIFEGTEHRNFIDFVHIIECN